ncbi:MAG: hypothetical protein JOY77_04800 [Alphaproteobacteria bacterium]|nr:hypothetical protein [Alphaproteobacteria bacterium]MBV9062234.1 hypothetical protein [Alphaproteobacteria bacterium]
MSRVAFVLAAATLAVIASVSGLSAAPKAAEPQLNAFGIPVAPQSGNASVKQWGGVDDLFAVNPDGDETPAAKSHALSSNAKGQDDADADANDPGDPDADHADEVLAI